MKRPRIQPALPLLVKDLTELAARKRTYVVRSVYSVALFTICLIAFYVAMLQTGFGSTRVLGIGRQVFMVLAAVQIGGVYLLLPAMMCGVITSEKERNSLMLLMLTTLRPWEILLQKFLGRLLVMATFLLLCLPLLAVCYAYGGVESNQLLCVVYIIVLTCLQVGAIAVMCSTFCRTTAGAFILTYMLLGAIYYLPLIVYFENYRSWRGGGGEFLVFIPAYWLEYVFMNVTGRGTLPLDMLVSKTVNVWITIVASLLFARYYLTSRALVTPRNFLLNFFKALDRFFKSVNVGGVMIIKEKVTLPEDQPVAWRELYKKSLGKPHYLFRILVFLEMPVLIFSVFNVVLFYRSSYGSQENEFLTVMMCIVWAIALLLIAVHGASLFTSERSRQTLDVLLTTPLATRQIVMEKARAMQRLVLILTIPILTIGLFEAYTEDRTGGYRDDHATAEFYMICLTVCTLIYLPLFSWVAVLIGMWAKSQTRAIIAAVVTLVAWSAGLFMFLVLAAEMFFPLAGINEVGETVLFPAFFLSPVSVLFINEISEWNVFKPTPKGMMLAMNTAVHIGLLIFVRRMCYAFADRLLGRVAMDSGIETTERQVIYREYDAPST